MYNTGRVLWRVFVQIAYVHWDEVIEARRGPPVQVVRIRSREERATNWARAIVASSARNKIPINQLIDTYSYVYCSYSTLDRDIHEILILTFNQMCTVLVDEGELFTEWTIEVRIEALLEQLVAFVDNQPLDATCKRNRIYISLHHLNFVRNTCSGVEEAFVRVFERCDWASRWGRRWCEQVRSWVCPALNN